MSSSTVGGGSGVNVFCTLVKIPPKRAITEGVSNLSALCLHENMKLCVPNEATLVSQTVRANDAPLYIRPAMADLITEMRGFLESDTYNTFTVQGIPGCGKTMTVWSFVKHCVFGSMMKCVWYNPRLGVFLYLEPTGSSDAIVTKSRTKGLESILTEYQPHFVVIDSIKHPSLTPDMIDQLARISDQIPVITIMSMQAVLDDQTKTRLCVQTFKMVEWSLDDYFDAVEIDSFFQSVFEFLKDGDDDILLEDCLANKALRRELVNRKFPLAGVCARWMFDFTWGKVILAIDEEIERIDVFDVVRKRSCGETSIHARNSLVYSKKARSNEFTSDMVLRRLVKKVSPIVFVEEMSALAHCINNPSLDGIILETDVIAAIKQKDPKMLQNRFMKVIIEEKGLAPVSTETLPEDECVVTRIIDFQKDVLTDHRIGDFLSGTQVPDGWVFIPAVFNQGGFDLVRILRRNGTLYMVFLQVTRQEGHAIKMRYFHQFLHSYNYFAPSHAKIFNIIVQVVVPFTSYQKHHLPRGNEIQMTSVITRGQKIRFERCPVPDVTYELIAFKRTRNA